MNLGRLKGLVYSVTDKHVTSKSGQSFSFVELKVFHQEQKKDSMKDHFSSFSTWNKGLQDRLRTFAKKDPVLIEYSLTGNKYEKDGVESCFNSLSLKQIIEHTPVGKEPAYDQPVSDMNSWADEMNKQESATADDIFGTGDSSDSKASNTFGDDDIPF